MKRFEQEINNIHNKKLQQFAIEALKEVPRYFFEVPASSSGKYHPLFSNQQGGLVYHTKMAMQFAIELFRINKFTKREQDIILISLLFHDCQKSGTQAQYEEAPHTKFEHPTLAANFILTQAKKFGLSDKIGMSISKNIASHMGQWNTNPKYSQEILATPKTKIEKFVHMCDYLSSKKSIFDNDYVKANEVTK